MKILPSELPNAMSLEKLPQPEPTRLIRYIMRFYRSWAYFVADHAVLMISVCTVLTLFGTVKVITTPNENDITGYTPYGARARDELEVASEFFSRGGSGIAVFVLILPKNGGNALNKDVLEEALRVEEILSTNFTIYNQKKNVSESYRQFCYSFCQINQPLVQFTNGYLLQKSLSTQGLPLNDRLQLTYPVSTIYNRKLNIQPNFFGLELSEVSQEDAMNTSSSTANKIISNMKAAKMMALQLRAERKDGWTTQMVKDFEMTITEYFEKDFSSSSIRVLTLSTSFVEAEVVRAGMSLLPFLIIGFAIMATVSSLTTFLSALYMKQFNVHKLSLAIMACVCPFMACCTALGALFFGGVRFGSILCVTPFLVLAIGVDDAYLMIHSWQRVTRKLQTTPVKEDSSGYRLAEVLSDTGPAIMISALTNILADTVGTYTGSPEITLLAYGNMACIFVDFIYQITFYSAVMALAGNFEIEAERKKAFTQTIACGDDNETPDTSDKGSVTLFHDRVKYYSEEFLSCYVSLVTNKLFNTFVILLWLTFLAVCALGITRMPINLTPKKLFSKDSSLQEMDDLRVAYVIPHFTLATLFVNNPGNLSDPNRLKRLNQFVSEIESLPGAWGPESTNYFLRDFVEYEKTMRELEAEGEEVKEDGLLHFEDLYTFLQWPEYEFWRGFVRMNDDNNKTSNVLERFFLTTAFRGKHLREWVQRDEMLKQWRSVVDRYYPEFNVTVFSDDGIYLDLIDNMPTDTWQAATATLGCMAVICFIFMYDLFTVCVASGVIASIMTGILGILSLTGTELDPIVMAALIISIGFSVDIPAHVSYHYHTAEHHLRPPIDVRDRLHYCISSVGFPALQASLSTSLCVLALLFVSIYMSQVFVKTMIVCMMLCVIHGLLLVPCVVSALDPLLLLMRKK